MAATTVASSTASVLASLASMPSMIDAASISATRHAPCRETKASAVQ
jgi:hypothetical protein